MLAALISTGFAYSVSQTALLPALPEIERAVDTSMVGATALMTVFFLAGAISVGPSGRFGDMFGKRRLLVIEMGLFTVGAVVCVLATTLPLLLLGRITMGLAVGLFPLSFAILRDELPLDRLPMGLALLSSTIGLGAATGLTLGGIVADAFGYEWSFAVAAVMGAVSTAAVVAFVPESPVGSPGRVDFVGVALLALGVAAPLVAISQVPGAGVFDVTTVGGCVLGVVVLGAFVWHERDHPEPLLDLQTLMQRSTALTNLTTMVIGFGMFGGVVILVQFLQVPASTGFGFGASATEAGLLVVPGALLALSLAPMAGRLTALRGAKVTLLLGVGTATLSLILLTLAHGSPLLVVVWTSLLMGGNGLAIAATPALILASVHESRSGESTGVNTIFRFVGSSWGTLTAAALIAGSSGAGGLATEHGYTLAFGAQAISGVMACVLASMIPRSVGATSQSAAVLPEPPV